MVQHGNPTTFVVLVDVDSSTQVKIEKSSSDQDVAAAHRRRQAMKPSTTLRSMDLFLIYSTFKKFGPCVCQANEIGRVLSGARRWGDR